MKVLLAAGLLLFAATACGDDDDPSDATGDDTTSAATAVDIVAKDFAFVVPATIKGGTLDVNYSNQGQEPHFAAFAKAADGKTFADIKAFLTAAPGTAPAGPPPFTEMAGAPTANPGGSGKMTFDLPEGTYALFCAIASPDGVPHMAKGMLSEVTVTAGEPVDQPESDGSITAADFSYTELPDLEEGSNTVEIVNNGKQLHEINLVELQAGKTVADLSAWAASEDGPPPAGFFSGVAVAPGTTGTTTVDLKKGSTYAFVCLIPDNLGDRAPHITKGMATGTFTV